MSPSDQSPEIPTQTRRQAARSAYLRLTGQSVRIPLTPSITAARHRLTERARSAADRAIITVDTQLHAYLCPAAARALDRMDDRAEAQLDALADQVEAHRDPFQLDQTAIERAAAQSVYDKLRAEDTEMDALLKYAEEDARQSYYMGKIPSSEPTQEDIPKLPEDVAPDPDEFDRFR